ncbi:hypothetical protein IGI39_002634 [Enterococcus sp. AZ135]|uniref:MerR family transcriptional regulator n=1 Tax=unclassified Enterococcus TaxID=2608891 RepID=UPI003F224C62
MYTIGQVSQMFDLPVSTLRYYDKEGLFPEIQRVSGIRKFSDNELEALRVIDCLKKSGLEIKDIKQFMEWSKQGSQTFEVRKNLFEKQKAVVEEEIAKLNRVLDMIQYKCWYYDEALKLGGEERLQAITPDEMPEKIKTHYEHSH